MALQPSLGGALHIAASKFILIIISLALGPGVVAQTACSSSISAGYPAPTIASGYSARIIANGLSRPRGIKFDGLGNLLVVESGKGITALILKDDGGNCVTVTKTLAVIQDTSLNHGIEMSSDGKTLYASNSDQAFSWAYDAKTLKNTTAPRTIVSGMNNTDHSTRTLLLSKKVPGQLLISRGSTSNIDLIAEDIKSGHSQIRAFDLSSVPSGGYTYSSDGMLLGWGLRNSVGVDEEPITGGIYSIENSVDDIMREGKDIHENNPGEELNFHGYLNGTKVATQGGNHGYPYCYAAWNVSEIPEAGALQVGQQFAMGDQNSTLNDTTCAHDYIAPRLTFPSHWAPLDIKFNSKGTVAYMTSHGSWDKDNPDGYLLYAVSFANGFPVEPANSTKAVVTILGNVDNSRCPNVCFRPVGLAWDSKGRLFMTSDSTGEIYVIGKSNGGALDGAALTATGTGSASPATSSKAGAVATLGGMMEPNWSLMLGIVLALSTFGFGIGNRMVLV